MWRVNVASPLFPASTQIRLVGVECERVTYRGDYAVPVLVRNFTSSTDSRSVRVGTERGSVGPSETAGGRYRRRTRDVRTVLGSHDGSSATRLAVATPHAGRGWGGTSEESAQADRSRSLLARRTTASACEGGRNRTASAPESKSTIRSAASRGRCSSRSSCRTAAYSASTSVSGE